MADYVEIKHLVKTPSFTGTKSLDGNQFRIWIRYNTVTEVWYMDLTMMRNSTVAIKGIALLPGKDLLAAHGYGNILGEIWVEDTSGANDNPTYEGMGDRWRIRYYPIGV